MSDWSILEKCIQRAEENNYECEIPPIGRLISEDGYICGGSYDGDAIHYYQVIFDIEFISAFFLNKELGRMVKQANINEVMKDHLINIVVLNDKIDYFKNYIE